MIRLFRKKDKGDLVLKNEFFKTRMEHYQRTLADRINKFMHLLSDRMQVFLLITVSAIVFAICLRLIIRSI
ncbi:hypothetical protein ACFOG5_02210 [Pedobacter fastidiosus]|uniref:hypothetical protein n=1 Tax=Pedobacter fastidiosus TaxID=2765361 RepID=UPI001C9B5BC7|nr:hypothetical protein [Pedobacter fastidiosus]